MLLPAWHDIRLVTGPAQQLVLIPARAHCILMCDAEAGCPAAQPDMHGANASKLTTTEELISDYGCAL